MCQESRQESDQESDQESWNACSLSGFCCSLYSPLQSKKAPFRLVPPVTGPDARAWSVIAPICACAARKRHISHRYGPDCCSSRPVRQVGRGLVPSAGGRSKRPVLDHFAPNLDHFEANLDHFAAILDHFHAGFDMP
jgi:hypothetical protein